MTKYNWSETVPEMSKMKMTLLSPEKDYNYVSAVMMNFLF